MLPNDLLLAKEASQRQRDIMLVKAKRLLDGRDFKLTDPKDLFLNNDARDGLFAENCKKFSKAYLEKVIL